MRTISMKEEWEEDAVEELIAADSTAAFTAWVPNVGRDLFRRIGYVEYDGGCEPTFVRPSRRLHRLSEYYYRTREGFAFVGAKAHIKIFYYAYHPWLKYYQSGDRPAVFDGSTYIADPNGPNAGAVITDADIDAVSNWMLEKHNKTVLAGTLAALYADKQDPRQNVNYSKFNQGIADMIRAESTTELQGGRHG
jgi:hypothetical protein